MQEVNMSWLVWLGGLLVLLVWAVMAYNRLMRLRNQVANAFGQIDVQLKRRYDLIPNLVEVARKYVQHERETLEAVVAARQRALTAEGAAVAGLLKPGALQGLAGAEQALGGALGRLMAVVENYPELQADDVLHDLHEELAHTENRIGFARQAYNDMALEYNDVALHFPTVVVARLLGFWPMDMLPATQSEAERQPPAVRL